MDYLRGREEMLNRLIRFGKALDIDDIIKKWLTG
jgi:hypothetical protein